MSSQRWPSGRGRYVVAAVAVTLLLLGSAGCSSSPPAKHAKVSDAVSACRSQWGDVAQTILDMDSETNPSALSQRWSTIIAGVDFQRHNADGRDCVSDIAAQVKDIDLLRKLSTRLRPYDMEYQLRVVAPQVELYLNDPLPKPHRNDNGQRVRPPAKKAVQAAYQVLSSSARQANTELRPAWEQAVGIDLGSADAIRTAIRDLDRLASSSPAFGSCEQALQVLVAAVRATQAG